MVPRNVQPFFTPRHARAGFTLVELLAVIAIILILAGLLLHVAGSAQYKSSVARANTEIKAMENGLENYKADYGVYPRSGTSDTSDATDNLNAQSTDSVDPLGAKTQLYKSAGEVLYQALAGLDYVTNPGTLKYAKNYMSFVPTQLKDDSNPSSNNSIPVTQTTYIIDPFGMPYGYSTAAIQAVQTSKSNGTPVDTTLGYNSGSYDLWSSAGYSATGGRAYPTDVTAANYNTLWAKNW